MSKGNWLRNKDLYKLTKQIECSKKISHSRLRFFGHDARLPEGAPAKCALYEETQDNKKPKGRPPTAMLSVLNSQLKKMDFKLRNSHTISTRSTKSINFQTDAEANAGIKLKHPLFF